MLNPSQASIFVGEKKKQGDYHSYYSRPVCSAVIQSVIYSAGIVQGSASALIRPHSAEESTVWNSRNCWSGGGKFV